MCLNRENTTDVYNKLTKTVKGPSMDGEKLAKTGFYWYLKWQIYLNVFREVYQFKKKTIGCRCGWVELV